MPRSPPAAKRLHPPGLAAGGKRTSVPVVRRSKSSGLGSIRRPRLSRAKRAKVRAIGHTPGCRSGNLDPKIELLAHPYNLRDASATSSNRPTPPKNSAGRPWSGTAWIDRVLGSASSRTAFELGLDRRDIKRSRPGGKHAKPDHKQVFLAHDRADTGRGDWCTSVPIVQARASGIRGGSTLGRRPPAMTPTRNSKPWPTKYGPAPVVGNDTKRIAALAGRVAGERE